MDKDLFWENIQYKSHECNQLPGRNKSGGYIENPMHKVYGKLENKFCKHCSFLVKKSYSKTYYKCSLRGNVDKCSTKSDHKINWNACGKFENEINKI